MEREETTLFLLYTIMYVFLCGCLVAPPSEFVAAGLTIQNIFSHNLGSENLNFVYYHIRRTAATLLVHSVLPLGYYVSLGWFLPSLGLFNIQELSYMCTTFLLLSLLLPCLALAVTYYWSWNRWNNHPISKQLSCLDDNRSWRAVASSIDIEFRRIDKFMSGLHSRRVIVTDSWVIKTSTYSLDVAHQNDIHLTLSGSEDHYLSYENMTAVQYLNIAVGCINPAVKPFIIRLNSMEYQELKEKLQAPIRNARNIVIRQSLSDQFLEAFREQVNQNRIVSRQAGLEVDNCVGCMQKDADIKLHKLCDNLNEGDCTQCYCRPMWCLECMGKWFASRQDQQNPETWLGGKAPCPTCRAKFCVLDVCNIC